LTFDDSLLCQYDIAAPVLESVGIKAFFNVYSSAFSGNPDPLEIFRYFRTVAFDSIEEFYLSFFDHLRNSKLELYKKGSKSFQKNSSYLDQFPFYSVEDKMFRFFRDRILGKENYNILMQELILEMNFDVSQIPEKVFMSTDQLIDLRNSGHRIGLHSDSHPTEMASLPREEQHLEYTKNYNFIQSILGVDADSMAHPCGSYSEETIRILREIGVRIGFGSSMNANKWGTEFEIPREDHMTIRSMVTKF
jgi:peptidoglycan/xylan/chitin deacetylase (PgdA/CDA1 family)